MANRREFLQITMATSAMAAINRATATPDMLNRQGTLGYFKVVYDERYVSSRAFADHAAAQGLPVAEVKGGDITTFWQKELDKAWKQNPVPVMGLTDRGPLFCLEQLAPQFGMKVVFRAEHATRGSRHQLTHAIEGPEALVAACQRFNPAQSDDWPRAMADLMLDCPTGTTELKQTEIRTTALHAAGNDQDETLYSWIIAPARAQSMMNAAHSQGEQGEQA